MAIDRDTTPFTVEQLTGLGSAKLAALLLEEAEGNFRFAQRVDAALEALRGAAAVAAIADERLGELERNTSFVEPTKSREFAAELELTVAIIADELAALDPPAAADRMLRIFAAEQRLHDRVEDRDAHLEFALSRASDRMAAIFARMASGDIVACVERILPRINDDPSGHHVEIALAAIGNLPAETLEQLDLRLARDIDAAKAPPVVQRDWKRYLPSGRLIRLRQAIADRRQDLDQWIALETLHGPQAADKTMIIQRLLAAGRPREALEWIRRGAASHGGAATRGAESSGTTRDFSDMRLVRLELACLDAIGDVAAAHALRWQAFEATLDADMLRELVARAADDETRSVERAFAHAAIHRDFSRGLSLFIAWPRLDLAARHVIDHRQNWSRGASWDLERAARSLEADFPDAATILYRAPLDEILQRARSRAYGDAARYFTRLDHLAPRLEMSAVIGDHGDYRAGLRATHGRKLGFWARVRE